jgi:hypothetical protein
MAINNMIKHTPATPRTLGSSNPAAPRNSSTPVQ